MLAMCSTNTGAGFISIADLRRRILGLPACDPLPWTEDGQANVVNLDQAICEARQQLLVADTKHGVALLAQKAQEPDEGLPDRTASPSSALTNSRAEGSHEREGAQIYLLVQVRDLGGAAPLIPAHLAQARKCQDA